MDRPSWMIGNSAWEHALSASAGRRGCRKACKHGKACAFGVLCREVSHNSSRTHSANDQWTACVNMPFSCPQKYDSLHHTSIHGPAQSISELMNHRHPETPTCTPSRLNPANEDPDNEGDDTPGGNPPNDEGGDLDDEPDHDDEDNGLNAQDHCRD